ncbi:MAG TPA: substrate-binding domain-containing protein [Xanthobacteraceae bacterium]|nr:substrate-binding domain-containing protein [Xanthobacteraceae bacterium]
MKLLLMAAFLAGAFSARAVAAEIKVLSAGAVEPGIRQAAEAYQRATGNTISIQFNTAPQLVKKLADGVVADILIAPPGVLDGQVKDGKAVADGRTMLGRVGAGILVRAGAPLPDVSSVDALKRALIAADRVVYNTASSGLYIEKMLERIGVGAEVKAKTQRYPTGEAVMMHIISGKGNEIGFGAITEIKQFEPKGAKLVGPLPAELQNYTSYGVAMLSNAPAKDAAKAFLAYLASSDAKRLFASAGIE